MEQDLAPRHQGALAILRPVLPRARLGLLITLALVGSLSEGLGLMLLVPLLGLASGEVGGTIAGSLAAFGLPLRLDLLLALFVGLVTFRTGIVQWRMLAEARLRMDVTDGLRTRIFSALLGADWRWLSRQRRGDLLAMTTSYVDRAGAALQFLLSLIAGLITLAVMLGAALLIAPGPAVLTGLGGLTVLALYAGLRRNAARDGAALGQDYKSFFEFYTERFDALRMIKSLGKGPGEAVRAQAMAKALASAHMRHQRGLGLGQVVLQAGSAGAMALAVWLALDRWQVPLALLLPLIALFARSVPLLGVVQTCWQQFGHNLPAVHEIGELLSEAQDHAEAPLADDAVPPILDRELTLTAVTLRHEGRDMPALDAVSLAFAKGTTTFITGPSGSGKSTLADLLAGLVQPDAGHLAIDGAALDRSTLSAWRTCVAYVQQEPLLFDTSVRENLQWAAPQADEAALIAALHRASAGFVLDLPQGLDTRVGSSGRQLSGGEKQRIVLARALLHDPALLILDEATSALDAENEAAIYAAVAAMKGQITVIIIGHGSTLSSLAERTVRLEAGRVI